MSEWTQALKNKKAFSKEHEVKNENYKLLLWVQNDTYSCFKVQHSLPF